METKNLTHPAELTINPKTIKVAPIDNSLRSSTGHTSDIQVIDTSPLSEKTPISQQPNVSLVDNAHALDPQSFPDRHRNDSNQVIGTIPNLQHLLTSYGVGVRYNVIFKKLVITIPRLTGAPDNADSSAYATIVSLASLNGMPIGQLQIYLEAIGNQNPLNPIADWISSRPWDGVDRLESFYSTLTQEEDFPAHLKKILMRRWLLSAVAAALLPSGFRCRGVLTIQGPQLLGKTAWVKALVPDPLLCEGAIKLDHHLDASSKDSILTAISHWIVEIGELDSSFKRDIARLKGFLTSTHDKVRRPYGRVDSSYPRRTVFCASVNESNFLIDVTGNSRWWTIPVTAVDYEHTIDMQQLFAQMAVLFHDGEVWWLDPDEDMLLESLNKKHSAVTAIGERVTAAIDLDRIGAPNLPAMSSTEILSKIEIEFPTNQQCKECVATLRSLLGKSKRIRGQDKWRVPLKDGNGFGNTFIDADDDY